MLAIQEGLNEISGQVRPAGLIKPKAPLAEAGPSGSRRRKNLERGVLSSSPCGCLDAIHLSAQPETGTAWKTIPMWRSGARSKGHWRRRAAKVPSSSRNRRAAGQARSNSSVWAHILNSLVLNEPLQAAWNVHFARNQTALIGLAMRPSSYVALIRDHFERAARQKFGRYHHLQRP